MAPSRMPERTITAMAGLTLATGLVDAASYLGLGHVFTANMTGNIVFLGFALGGAAGFSISSSLFALAGFLVGAFVGGRMVPPGATARRAARAFGLEVVMLVAAALTTTAAGASSGAARSTVLALLGLGMGLQNAAVRRLGVADMTTTVLTLTLTGIAADSRLAGGTDPHVARRVSSVVLMLVGAVIGAALVRQAVGWSVAAGVAVVGTGTFLLLAPRAPAAEPVE